MYVQYTVNFVRTDTLERRVSKCKKEGMSTKRNKVKLFSVHTVQFTVHTELKLSHDSLPGLSTWITVIVVSSGWFQHLSILLFVQHFGTRNIVLA